MQNYIIFNKQNKVLIVKSQPSDENFCKNRIIYCNSEILKSHNFSTLFLDNQTDDYCIIADGVDTQTIFQKAVSNLYFVEAAGGIVQNERKDILFMYRNGFWDLPKGHREKGEQIIETAKREVLEECGMQDLEVKEFLSCSYHTYTMHGRREIKQTYWYRMFCSSKETLIPQTEEGIKKLEWVSLQDLDSVLKLSYPNLQYLFKSIKL